MNQKNQSESGRQNTYRNILVFVGSSKIYSKLGHTFFDISVAVSRWRAALSPRGRRRIVAGRWLCYYWGSTRCVRRRYGCYCYHRQQTYGGCHLSIVRANGLGLQAVGAPRVLALVQTKGQCAISVEVSFTRWRSFYNPTPPDAAMMKAVGCKATSDNHHYYSV